MQRSSASAGGRDAPQGTTSIPIRGDGSDEAASLQPYPARFLSPNHSRFVGRDITNTAVAHGAILPLQFSSLEHFDECVAAAVEHARTVDGLQPTTCAWVSRSYRSFRRYLKETRSEHLFLGGDVQRQLRVLQGWIAWLRLQNVSRTAINTYWRGLSSLCRWFQERDGTVNPLRLLVAPRVGRLLPRCLTKNAAETILAFVRNYPWKSPLEKTRNLALVSCMLFAGMRRSEVVRLAYGDVHLSEETIRIVGGKGRYGGKDRTCYMPPQLHQILEAYDVERRRSGRTAPAFFTDLRRDKGIGFEPLRRLCERIAKGTGIHVSPHVFRHTYATLLRQAGVPDRVAMDLLGHTSLAMLQRYSHVFSGEHRTEAAKLVLDIDL